MIKILCLADLHLTERKPPCRLDNEDWIDTISRKIDFVAETSRNQSVDYIVIAGDLFDSVSGNSIAFLGQCMKWLAQLNGACHHGVVAIAGNHDIINGSYGDIERSPYSLMETAGLLKAPSAADFGSMLYGEKNSGATQAILIGHYGLYLKEKPYPTAPDSGNVEWFVNNCLPKTCRLFITGHFHKPFVVKVNDTVIVNCGSILRLRADQIDYEPYLTICTVDDEAVRPKKYPVPLACQIRRDYLDVVREQKAELEEMVGNVDGDFEVTLNFKDNFYKLTDNLEDKDAINQEFERCNK